MNRKTALLADFDPAKFLDSPDAFQVYIDELVETNDPAFIAESLGVVALAKGTTKLAKDTGLSREQLYRSLSGTGNPTLNTLLAVISSLNLKLQTVVLSENK